MAHQRKDIKTMKKHIELFVKKINNTTAIDKLIKVESFRIDDEHTAYLYAYRTVRGMHIETGASVGTPNFTNWKDVYCRHTLHEYVNTNAELESRIERLLLKTVAQLDVLAPLERTNIETSDRRIL